MEGLLEQVQKFAETNLVPYAFDIVAALAIFIIGRIVVGLVTSWAEKLLDKRVDHTVARFIANILNIALLAFVIIAALEQLGMETTSLVAILGAAGLAVGLALKDSLGNFASGVMLIMFRPFRVGDYVEAGGAAGTVKEIKIFATIIGTPDNKVITVPNGAIMSGNITNYSAMPTRRVDLVVGVGYDADLSQVKTVLQDILSADERILKDPAPVIAVAELADSSVNLIVRPWVNSADYWAVYWGVTEAVKNRFDQEGINIPFPQMDVHMNKVES